MRPGSVRTTSVITSPGCTAAATTPQSRGSRRRISAVNSTCRAAALSRDLSGTMMPWRDRAKPASSVQQLLMWLAEICSAFLTGKLEALGASQLSLHMKLVGITQERGCIQIMMMSRLPVLACCDYRQPERSMRAALQSVGRLCQCLGRAHAFWTTHELSALACCYCSAKHRDQSETEDHDCLIFASSNMHICMGIKAASCEIPLWRSL